MRQERMASPVGYIRGIAIQRLTKWHDYISDLILVGMQQSAAPETTANTHQKLD